MIKKNILIVCKSFYPENNPRAFRATELVKELALQGHDVSVLTPKDDKFHSVFEEKHKVKIYDLGILRWKSPDFGQTTVGYFLTRFFFRLLNLGFEYPDVELMFLTAQALKKQSAYDLLISIAVPYPIHWGVATVWKKNQNIAKKWIADCGDPYVGCTTDSFRKWFYWTWVEKWFMRKTDYITIPVESARSAYFAEFQSKIKIIPQGFKIELQEQPVYIKNYVPTFAYAGGFIPNVRDPRPFLDYLCSSTCDFRFIIFTNNRALIEEYNQKLKDKLTINDYVPRDTMLKKLREMDFLVNFDNNTTTAVPSKLIDYVIINRPVLNIKRNIDTESVDQFLAGNYESKMQLPDVDYYKIENVCKAFLDLINE